MPTDVIMPQMGESIFEGTITKWLKKVGDAVEKDEPLFEISTDKVDAEIPSPVAGVLADDHTSLKAPRSRSTPSSPSSAKLAPPQPPSKSPPHRRRSKGCRTASARTEVPAARHKSSPGAAAPQAAQVVVVMPQLGESIFEGTITKWLKKPGDPVQKDEPLLEISTDKVDAEIPSPVSGILTEIRVPEGATVEINAVLAIIGGPGATLQLSSKNLPQRRCPHRRWQEPPLRQSRGLPHAGAAAVAASVLRRWRAASPKSTASTSARSPAPAPKAASPKTMCCVPMRDGSAATLVQRSAPPQVPTPQVRARGGGPSHAHARHHRRAHG